MNYCIDVILPEDEVPTSNNTNKIYTKLFSYIKKLKSYNDIGTPQAISDSHSSQCHLTLKPYVA